MELIQLEDQRYTLFPIKYPEIWNNYKKQLGCIWITSEIDFSKDKNDFDNKLNDNERHDIKYVLTFFEGSDGIVNINILNNFVKEIKILEAQIAYNFQGVMEGIHNETYSTMIDILIDDEEEKKYLFNSLENIECIGQKGRWALKYSNNNIPLNKRLLAYIIVEGLFFSSSFCCIYWIKQKNILAGLTKSNEFISRDERLHTEFGIILYSMLKNKLSSLEVYEIMDEALEIEIEFVLNSLPVKLLGMNSELMVKYVKYVADRLLKDLGYEMKYMVTNPFSFMNNIGLESRSKFFDERTSTYKKILNHQE